MTLRPSLVKSLASMAYSHGLLYLGTLSKPQPGRRSDIYLTVASGNVSLGAFRVLTCAKDEAEQVQADVLAEAKVSVHASGYCAA